MQHDPMASMLEVFAASRRAIRLLGERDFDSFKQDETVLWSVWAQFVLIGEACRRIPEEWQTDYPQFPWSEMIGMRHRLVHGYDRIIWERVYETVRKDLPKLVANIEEILPCRPPES